jgi:hypothetical protein
LSELITGIRDGSIPPSTEAFSDEIESLRGLGWVKLGLTDYYGFLRSSAGEVSPLRNEGSQSGALSSQCTAEVQKFCTACGARIQCSARFCASCGTQLSTVVAPRPHAEDRPSASIAGGAKCYYCQGDMAATATRCPRCNKYLKELEEDRNKARAFFGSSMIMTFMLFLMRNEFVNHKGVLLLLMLTGFGLGLFGIPPALRFSKRSGERFWF